MVLYKYGAVAFFNTPEEHQAAVLQALQQAQEAHRASAASAAGGLGGGAKVAADSSGGGGGNGGGDALAHVARTTREGGWVGAGHQEPSRVSVTVQIGQRTYA